MKVTGIVVEYNPLHNGHIYHFKQAQSLTNSDIVIAVMSGNFVQRGEFAIVDKWQRCQAALDMGVDLVLELPFPFVCQSATQFSNHAIDILAQAKVDSLVFGSETNNLSELQEFASLSFSVDNFKENMDKGYSYPASYGYLASSYGPNDILAIAYLKTLQSYPDITPYLLKRTSPYHQNELNSELPSGLAIRTARMNNKPIDEYTPLAKVINEYPITNWDMYYPYLQTQLLTMSKQELHNIFMMEEGIENMLVKQAYQHDNYQDFINNSISKRYTRSRIQRILCHLITHNTKEMMASLPPYTTLRPLGFNDNGKQYMKFLQRQGVSIANKFSDNQKEYRELEYKAAVAYSLTMPNDKKQEIRQRELAGLYL